jgi:hypothetical protein
MKRGEMAVAPIVAGIALWVYLQTRLAPAETKESINPEPVAR